MTTVTGLIFSNLHDQNIPELTKRRTMASVPFGGRYRLVDFSLSNMVNAGINKIGIITHYNYQSLMDHIGSGKADRNDPDHFDTLGFILFICQRDQYTVHCRQKTYPCTGQAAQKTIG